MKKENHKNETQNEIHRERETEGNASVISLRQKERERHTEILVEASIHRRKELVSIVMHFDPTKGIAISPIFGRMYC